MPIYEYRCRLCDHLFEEWAKSFDSPNHEPCPKCGGDAERIMSRTSFVLEGTGWYVTEYGNRKTDHESGAGAPGEGHPAKVAEEKKTAEADTKQPEASTSAAPQPSGGQRSDSATAAA